jgi:hypothetical protein
MNKTVRNGKVSPVDRQISLKTKLIKRLEGEIQKVERDAKAEIENIRFRISMAQTLVNALQKGR